MAATSVVQVLYQLPAGAGPERIWQVVQKRLADNWQPVAPAEVQELFDQFQAHLYSDDDLNAGRPPNWKWVIGLALTTMRHFLDGERLSVIQLATTISYGLEARVWRHENLHRDRYANLRSRYVDTAARLMMQVAPDDWLLAMLEGPVGNILAEPTLGPRLKSMRKAAGIRVVDMAKAAGVSPTEVYRWQRDEAKPSPRHAKALVELFPGTKLRDFV